MIEILASFQSVLFLHPHFPVRHPSQGLRQDFPYFPISMAHLDAPFSYEMIEILASFQSVLFLHPHFPVRHPSQGLRQDFP